MQRQALVAALLPLPPLFGSFCKALPSLTPSPRPSLSQTQHSAAMNMQQQPQSRQRGASCLLAAAALIGTAQAFLLPFNTPAQPQASLAKSSGGLWWQQQQQQAGSTKLQAALAERPRSASVTLDDSTALIEAETVALKPSSREEQAKDWFNSVLSTREPNPLFSKATELGVGRLVDGETRAPTRREEAWRFTDLSRVYSRRPGNAPAVLQPAQVALIKEKVKEHTLEVCEGRALVFVDGVFHPEFSPAGSVEGLREEGAREGWKVGSIFEFAGEEQEELLREIEWAPEVGMRHTLAAGSLPFSCLNQACVKDAACLVVGEKGEMAAPVQFLFVSTSTEGEGGREGGKEARVSHPRLVVIAKKRSAGKFVQSYIDVGGGVGLANACTTVRVDRRAEVQHLHANEMGGKGQLFDAVSVTTKKMSAYKNVFINVGGNVGRVNFQATMNGTEGRVETEGLTVSGEEQELDIHSFIHHLRKDGKSNMYQCNIVSGDSHCVFKGRMKLEPRARGVKADQLIRSIMLTDSCTVDAMPTLEVCSGDVDCTHGATVADIDENEAFYLQSRGIGRREARQVLMMGFAAQVYNQVPCERMRKRLGDRLFEVCPEVGIAEKYEYLSI